MTPRGGAGSPFVGYREYLSVHHNLHADYGYHSTTLHRVVRIIDHKLVMLIRYDRCEK